MISDGWQASFPFHSPPHRFLAQTSLSSLLFSSYIPIACFQYPFLDKLELKGSGHLNKPVQLKSNHFKKVSSSKSDFLITTIFLDLKVEIKRNKWKTSSTSLPQQFLLLHQKFNGRKLFVKRQKKSHKSCLNQRSVTMWPSLLLLIDTKLPSSVSGFDDYGSSNRCTDRLLATHCNHLPSVFRCPVFTSTFAVNHSTVFLFWRKNAQWWRAKESIQALYYTVSFFTQCSPCFQYPAL